MPVRFGLVVCFPEGVLLVNIFFVLSQIVKDSFCEEPPVAPIMIAVAPAIVTFCGVETVGVGGDVVGGGVGGGGRDGFGAYGIPGQPAFVAAIVIPCSIAIIHVHAVSVPVRLTLSPVCVRATVVH